MFNWTDDDSEHTPAPLDLARDLGRGKLNHRGDVMDVADALDQAGVYDKGRFGNPPLADEHLFKAIERFQDGQGLKVDGLMKPGGPTVTRLNAVLGRRAHVADADAAPVAAPAPALPQGAPERKNPKLQVGREGLPDDRCPPAGHARGKAENPVPPKRRSSSR